jgi:deoxyadenosine/deoxycytidine kinase
MIKPILWIEGIIASGKSTFAEEIARRLDFKYMPEPVEANPYLEEFYKDPKRWAWAMQMHLMGHRFGMKKAADYAAAIGMYEGLVLDRCIAGDRVFCKLHWEEGNIHDLEWQTYNYLYQIMARDLQPPTVFIYLDVQPQTAYDRMVKRARNAEAGVPLEYLQKLRNGYEELLLDLKRGLAPWAHSVEPHRFLWDGETMEDEQWNRVAATIHDLCRRGS